MTRPRLSSLWVAIGVVVVVAIAVATGWAEREVEWWERRLG